MKQDKKIRRLINKKRKEGKTIAYLDEVGTGAIFGEVVVGCVVLKDGFYHRRINDSKKLKPELRKRLSKIILKNSIDSSFGIADHNEINKIKNIWESDRRAMMRAVKNLSKMPDVLFVDGPNHKLDLPVKEIYYIKHGDATVFGIAAASIIAKHFRDTRIINKYSKMFPYYHLDSNKGYRTVQHAKAITKYGLTEYHRSYMKQVRRLLDVKRSNEMRPKIVCLCGSIEFKDAYEKANKEESLNGNMVLSAGYFNDYKDLADKQKTELSELHMKKIDMADEVLILNVKGHIDDFTKDMIRHAREKGKTIRYLEDPEWYGYGDFELGDVEIDTKDLEEYKKALFTPPKRDEFLKNMFEKFTSYISDNKDRSVNVIKIFIKKLNELAKEDVKKYKYDKDTLKSSSLSSWETFFNNDEKRLIIDYISETSINNKII